MAHRQNEQRERPKWAAATAMISLCGLVLAGCPSPDAVTDAGPASDAGFDTPAPYNDRPDTSLDVRVVLDAGNDVGSTTECRSTVCGDGLWNRETEECDNGALNADAPNQCSLDCRRPWCGNGHLDAGESCDDGNDTGGDGCQPTCRWPICGDGFLDPGESCDDANTDESDGCTSACAPPRCGDGILSGDEICDVGEASVASACALPCDIGVCGDGVRGGRIRSWVISEPRLPAEGTDREYAVGGVEHSCVCEDSCGIADPDAPENGVCQTLGFDRALAARYSGQVGTAYHLDQWACSHGACEFGNTTATRYPRVPLLASLTCEGVEIEQCDEGSANGDTPGGCRADCTLPRCGDGVVDPGEECDGPREQCTPDCRLPVCGNGVWEGEEHCDNGVNNSDSRPNACRVGCRRRTCGDGVVDWGEDCDDANDVDDDACPNDCIWGDCGDGVLGTGEECDPAIPGRQRDWGNSVSGCAPDCVLNYCGDGKVDPGEECEPHEVGCLCECYFRDPLFDCYDCVGNRYCYDDLYDDCGNGVLDSGEECDASVPGEAQCESDYCYLIDCDWDPSRTRISVPERHWPMTTCSNAETMTGGEFVFDDATLQAYLAIRATADEPTDTVSHFVGTVGQFVLSFEYRTENTLLGDSFSYHSSGPATQLAATETWQTASAVVDVGLESSPPRSVTFTVHADDATDERTPELHLRNVSVVEVPDQVWECPDW